MLYGLNVSAAVSAELGPPPRPEKPQTMRLRAFDVLGRRGPFYRLRPPVR
jgi:hypothetical protein